MIETYDTTAAGSSVIGHRIVTTKICEAGHPSRLLASKDKDPADDARDIAPRFMTAFATVSTISEHELGFANQPACSSNTMFSK